MKVAREAAKAYVDLYHIIGFTSGGCGDILQNADSETAVALTTSLMAMEIPGIYLRTDADRLYVFDHVKVTGINRNKSSIVLQIYNPTAFDASVSILAESAEKARQPLGLNAFINWPKVDVKAGKTVKYKIKLN